MTKQLTRTHTHTFTHTANNKYHILMTFLKPIVCSPVSDDQSFSYKKSLKRWLQHLLTHTLSFMFLFLMLWATQLAFTKFLLYEGLSQVVLMGNFTCRCWSCKRLRFDPRVGKIPWSRKRRPIPVFLPGKFHGQRSLWATVHGATESHHSLVFNLACSHCHVKHLMCI